MPLYELINPSDPYTFEAPSIEVAAASAWLLSSGFGAKAIDGDEATPVLFGCEDWMKARGMDSAGWFTAHESEIAAALDSFLIGKAADRADVEDMLAELPEEKREAWRARRQDRHRTSLNQIGERAYQLAEKLRAKDRE
jgi:hypothetical protein